MSKHTPGPWRWEFNERHRQLTLVGGRPKFDLTIMEFCRWGMWGAGVSMRDTVPEADGFNLMHKVHERPDWIAAFPGREHHKVWCAAIDHPDMRLMQAAPDLLEALEKMLDNEEQRGFEKWLRRSAPCGCCESVDAQWKMSSDYSEFLDDWAMQISAIDKARGEA